MDHRKALTRLRISAHHLAIETGRYTHPKIPVENRICPLCPGNNIEDEYHFLLVCPCYAALRKSLIDNISENCINFNNLASPDKFMYLLSAGIDIVKHNAKFVHDAFKLRENSSVTP